MPHTDENKKNEKLYNTATSYGITYLNEIKERAVYPTEEAIDNLTQFDEDLPSGTGDAMATLELLNNYGSPATVASMGSRYFGFVNGSVLPAGLAAKTLATFWDQNAAMQIMSPVSSKLESVVQHWLIDLFGFPEDTVAGYVSGTSMANFCGLIAARYRILKRKGWDVNEQGLAGSPQIRIVTCTQAHSSVLKAISMAGIGKQNIEWVDVDDQGRIIPENIPNLDDNTILILQAGNVNSGAFDNYTKICSRAKSQGAWIHVDGAFGLWAGATNRLRHLTHGMEEATSWAVDGHKTLNTPYDSGIIMCADKEALVSAVHMSGSYLILGKNRDGMFYTPEMSRRSRVIELWATLRHLGKKGIDDMIYNMHQRAQQFGKELSAVDGFSIVNDIVFNQVLVQCKDDATTIATINKIQELKTCWVGGSMWKGRKVIRISVCSWSTTAEDVSRSVASFREALSLINDKS